MSLLVRDAHQGAFQHVPPPKYFCIHYMFETEGKFLPSTMIMRGDVTLSLNGQELTFEPTAAYTASIREAAEHMRNRMQ